MESKPYKSGSLQLLNLDLFNFKSENVYCTFTFDVVGSGDTTVNLSVDYLTGTEADTYDELFESEKKDIDYIYNSANKVAGAAFTAKAVLVQAKSRQQLLSRQQQHSLQL